MALSLQMCFRGAPPQNLHPASDSQPSQSKSSASTPTPWRCSHRRISVSMSLCVQGHVGARPGHSTPRACGHRNSPESETLYRASASLSPETQTHHEANFGVLLLGSFWLFPSIWGTGWEGSACRARHLSFPKGPLAPPPPAAYVYNVQSVPPFPQKRAPTASENGRGAERG